MRDSLKSGCQIDTGELTGHFSPEDIYRFSLEQKSEYQGFINTRWQLNTDNPSEILVFM